MNRSICTCTLSINVSAAVYMYTVYGYMQHNYSYCEAGILYAPAATPSLVSVVSVWPWGEAH